MQKRTQGFTLIEVMVVVVILGLLFAIIVPKIINRPEEARIVKAKQDIMAIQSALDLYKLDNGRYPSTDQGLLALYQKPTVDPIPQDWKEGGYINKFSKDPWGHPYQYLYEDGKLKLFSYGPKGEEGHSEISAEEA